MLTGGVLWIAATTGAVCVGEAAALLYGTRPQGGRRNPWATPRNVAFLVSDIVLGAALIWLAIVPGGAAGRVALPVVLAALATTHAYRGWEYTAKRPNAFCANPQLFAVDLAKLLGVVLVAAGGLPVR